MTPHEALTKAIADKGTQTELANAVGCRQPTISGLVKRGEGASSNLAYWISAAVNFSVTPHQLCPAAFPKDLILPKQGQCNECGR